MRHLSEVALANSTKINVSVELYMGMKSYRNRVAILRDEIRDAGINDEMMSRKAGDVFELVPSHSDHTAKSYDEYYCIRNNKVEAVWHNYGRGKERDVH